MWRGHPRPRMVQGMTAFTSGATAVAPPLLAFFATRVGIVFGFHSEAVVDCSPVAGSPSGGRERTIVTVSRLTLTTCPIRRRIYVGSSARFGSLVMPLRLSVETWY